MYHDKSEFVKGVSYWEGLTLKTIQNLHTHNVKFVFSTQHVSSCTAQNWNLIIEIYYYEKISPFAVSTCVRLGMVTVQHVSSEDADMLCKDSNVSSQ